MAINYKYCPQCKSDMELKGGYSHCPNCSLTIYKNSIPTAGILPIRDGQVLLSKRAIEPFKGKWDIIGGFLNNGEHPKDGIKREAKEETGLDIEPTEILGIYIDEYGDGRKTLNIHYLGKIMGGDMKAQDDVAELQWVNIKDIDINEGFKNTIEALNDLKKKFSN